MQSENTPSHIPMTVKDSSTGYANDPLVNLLRLRKDRPVMTDEERRKAVMELRELRTSPQALGRALRRVAADEKDEEETGTDNANSASPKTKRSVPQRAVKDAVGDLYKDLGL